VPEVIVTEANPALVSHSAHKSVVARDVLSHSVNHLKKSAHLTFGNIDSTDERVLSVA
jgi:hypothetical protein